MRRKAAVVTDETKNRYEGAWSDRGADTNTKTVLGEVAQRNTGEQKTPKQQKQWTKRKQTEGTKSHYLQYFAHFN